MAKRKKRFINEAKRKETASRLGFTVEEYNPFEDGSEYDYYKKLARRADSRLRAIEKAALEDIPGMNDILKYAYRNAMYDIRAIRGSEYSRFGTGVKTTKEGELSSADLHRKINAVTRFLESPSSTVSGLKKVYKEKADSLNKSLDLKGAERLTWQDIANYYETSFAEKEDSKYGSHTKFRALGAVRRIANDPDKIKAATEGNLKLSKDETVNKIAVQMLQNGLDVIDVFGSK